MQTCSVTGARYKAMLEIYVIPELQQRNVIVWMPDGTPQHIATSVQQVLQQHFGDRIMARNMAVSRPPRTPDLILDGFLVQALSET